MFGRGGIKLGRLLGIDVYLHPTWFIILGIFSLSFARTLPGAEDQPTLVHILFGVMTGIIVFATLLAHEYGHALAARRYGIGTERITLFLLGGVAHLESEPRSPLQEFVIAIAGPLVSVLCALLFGGVYLLAALQGPQMPPMLLNLTFVLGIVAMANVVFVVFNMIPGFPMDGGRVLRSIIWGITRNYLQATRIAALGGQTFGWLLAILGSILLFQGNFGGLMWILMGVFLNWLAKTSYRQSQFRAAFENVSVRHLMRPVQVVVPADTPIRRVVNDFMYRIHGDRFPVVRGDNLLGYISSDDISQLDRREWDFVTAERLARPYQRADVLDPDADAFVALQKVSRSGRPQMPVFIGRRLVGFLFMQDVMHYLNKIAAYNSPFTGRKGKVL